MSVVSVDELKKKNLPLVPQIEGLIYLHTENDGDIKKVMSEVSAKLREAEISLEKKGVISRLFWGPMTWHPEDNPLIEKYPFLYEK